MEDNNIHKNHRKRMREKYEKHGADVFETHQLLEMLLFHSIKRSDTNAVAHDLLEKDFGKSALGFSQADLKQVCGIGDVSANLLRVSFDTTSRLLCDELSKVSLDSDFSRRAFLWIWFRNKPVHTVGVMLLDEKSRLLDCVPLAEGKNTVPDDYADLLCELMENIGARLAIIAHNHMYNVSSPSVEDMYLSGFLRRKLSKKGFTLAGHYIVTSSDCMICPIE